MKKLISLVFIGLLSVSSLFAAGKTKVLAYSSGGGGGGTPALIANTNFASGGTDNQTTGAINSTGANFCAVFIAYYTGGTVSGVTDSKGNTYTALTAGTAGNGGQWWYSANATVGASHTFTVSGTGDFPTIVGLAFSNVLTVSPLDGQNTNGGAVTTITTGSITPSANGDLILAGLSTGSSGKTFTINSGFTQIVDNTACCVAYYIQPTAGAINPTWSWDGSNIGACGAIAAFKHN